MQPGDPPGQHLGSAAAGDCLHGRWRSGNPRLLPLEAAASLAEEAPEKTLKVSGALMEPHLTEGGFAGLHD